MSIQRSTVVAVFGDRAMAEQTIEELKNAGVQNDQIFYSGGNTQSGFVATVKNLFTGEDYPVSNDVAGDLRSRGIPDEEAEYYAREHQEGHAIIAIDAGEQVRRVEEILNTNGTYNYGLNAGAAEVAAQQELGMPPSSEIQGIGDYTANTDSAQVSDRARSEQGYSSTPQPVQAQPSVTAADNSYDTQPMDPVTHNTSDYDTQPIDQNPVQGLPSEPPEGA